MPKRRGDTRVASLMADPQPALEPQGQHFRKLSRNHLGIIKLGLSEIPGQAQRVLASGPVQTTR
jgi:hypothetical protein